MQVALVQQVAEQPVVAQLRYVPVRRAPFTLDLKCKNFPVEVGMAGDRDLRRRLGDRARTIANERFLIRSAMDETDRLLRDQLM